ncbi:MAG TPA: FliA/WhiG family RNA polymerase sigma factor [Terriglobia bacterium]|nr:FliA/WhiG family RNA polymerase sigma factor [Terriglobia bacterium]
MSAQGNFDKSPARDFGSARFSRHSTRSTNNTGAHNTSAARPHSVRAAAQTFPSRDELAVKLLPLVRRVAFEMRERLPQHVEVDDLASAGVIGLLDAVRKFDARKHVKIETYARHRIRGAILDSLRDMDTASRDMRRKNKNAEKVCQQLQARLGRSVTDEEMAEALGISLRKWFRTVHELNSMGLDWMRPNHIPEPMAIDEANLPASEDENPFDLCYRSEQRNLVAKAAATLPERERSVISLYYAQDMTMKQIGEMLGIDESRVSQIHSVALAHLRSRVRKMLNPARPSLPPAFIAARVAAPACAVYSA